MIDGEDFRVATSTKASRSMYVTFSDQFNCIYNIPSEAMICEFKNKKNVIPECFTRHITQSQLQVNFPCQMTEKKCFVNVEIYFVLNYVHDANKLHQIDFCTLRYIKSTIFFFGSIKELYIGVKIVYTMWSGP